MQKKDFFVFSDVENPKLGKLTADQIHRSLEDLINSGYDYFSPDNLRLYSLGNLTMRHPDSPYGLRMELVKQIIVAGLYSNEGFVKYLSSISEETKKEAAKYEAKHESEIKSASYNAKKIMEGIYTRAKNFLGKADPEYSSEYDATARFFAEKAIQNKVFSDAYDEMTKVITSLGGEFNPILPDDETGRVEYLMDKVEVNHIFSGVKNGTNINLTFADERIREYGVKIQQLLERVISAGVEPDTQNPLSYDELFGFGVLDTYDD